MKAAASKGGKASHGGAGTESSSNETHNTNPGNFANRPTEEVKAIASKGGKASHGGSGGTGASADETSHNTNPGNFANR